MRIVTILTLVGLVGLLTTAGLSSCGESSSCLPSCTGKLCGSDGCGGTCGECAGGETCSTNGLCTSCTPDCAGKDCGNDGCGGSCGDCGANQTCDAQGQCQGACEPDCTGKACGDDGCDGSCGVCDAPDVCNALGQCEVCNPDCTNKVCGDDGCEGSCGTCPDNGTTCAAGQCVDFAPRPGVWDYDDWSPGTNTCNSDEVVSNGDGTFSLSDNGDGTFTVTPGDGGNPFDCNMVGQSFNCPERAASSVDIPNWEVILALKVTVDGTFASPQSMSGTQDGEAACTGNDCALVETALGTTFPCTFGVSFSARWISD